MKEYKHYSFDLWLTLIKSNSFFKNERVSYFHKHYNYSNNSIHDINTVFRRVDLMCNQINEVVGRNIDAYEMYLMVLYELNENRIDYSRIDLHSLYEKMECLILEYLPILTNEYVISTLETLKKQNVTLSILSNTGFIKGSTVRKILSRLEIHQYFDFEIYSDEYDLSKPNKDIFCVCLQKAQQINENINPQDIIHIGDNPNADIKGAKEFGFSTFMVTKDITIRNLLL